MRNYPRALTLTDIIILFVLIALLTPAILVNASGNRETSNRVKCGSNLRQIGQAITLYANENKGMKRDNIYTVGIPPVSPTADAGNSTTIAGSPTWDGDSVLLPVATIDPGWAGQIAARRTNRVLIIAGIVLLVSVAVILWLVMRRPSAQMPPPLPQTAFPESPFAFLRVVRG